MDVDQQLCQLPSAPPVIEWLEAELWEDVVDMFEATEATLGMETESLMRLREQPTMHQQERDMWRARLASSTARQRSRSRSRARGSTEDVVDLLERDRSGRLDGTGQKARKGASIFLLE